MKAYLEKIHSVCRNYTSSVYASDFVEQLKKDGWKVIREFRVKKISRRPDGKISDGFVDLVARHPSYPSIAIELDRKRPRARSLLKLSLVRTSYKAVVTRKNGVVTEVKTSLTNPRPTVV